MSRTNQPLCCPGKYPASQAVPWQFRERSPPARRSAVGTGYTRLPNVKSANNSLSRAEPSRSHSSERKKAALTKHLLAVCPECPDQMYVASCQRDDRFRIDCQVVLSPTSPRHVFEVRDRCVRLHQLLSRYSAANVLSARCNATRTEPSVI